MTSREEHYGRAFIGYVVTAFFAFVVILLCGCDDGVRYQSQLCCDPETKKRADFVLTCIGNGNPMSDEEPEDLVAQCAKEAERLYCRHIRGTVNVHENPIVFVPYTNEPACSSTLWSE